MGDADLCLRALEKGYYNVITPFAKLYHYEKFSRSKKLNEREFQDIRIFVVKHRKFLEKPDPFSSDMFYVLCKMKKLERWFDTNITPTIDHETKPKDFEPEI